MRLIIFILLYLFLAENSKCNEIDLEEFKIKLRDGIELDASRLFPKNITGKLPALIICHGYGLSKESEMESAKEFAALGYYVIVYSMRGQGKSGGESNLISFIEADDFKEVVQYVKNDERVNNTKIGAIGASQGGTVPFMAACTGLDLTAIVSQVGTPEMSDTWIENNSVKMTLLWSLSYPIELVRYNSQLKKLRSWILEDTPQSWDSIQVYFSPGRNFIAMADKCNTPVLITTVWQDKFFSSYGMLKIAEKLKAPSAYYLGTYDAHGADPFNDEILTHDNITSQWLQKYLMPELYTESTPIEKYTFAYSSYPKVFDWGIWQWDWKSEQSSSWPPPGIENIKFYLTPDKQLNYFKSDYTTDTLNLINSVSPSLTLTEAVNREFRGQEFEAKFKKHEITFDSKPMLNNVLMAGTPTANIYYSSHSKKIQFNVQIWEVLPNGQEKFITRTNYTQRESKPYVINSISFKSMSHSHMFSKGNIIRIKITNLDNTGISSGSYEDTFLRTNPHVLPVLNNSKASIIMNSEYPSFIELPLRGFQPVIAKTNGMGQSTKILSVKSFSSYYEMILNIEEESETHITVYKSDLPLKTIISQILQEGTYKVFIEKAFINSGEHSIKVNANDQEIIFNLINSE